MQSSVAHDSAQQLSSGTCGSGPGAARSWIWLAVAAVLLLFANGADTVALAAWLAPLFLLRFVRGQRLQIGLPAAYLVLVGAFAFQFRGMVPIPGSGYYIFLALMGISLIPPYAIDRLLVRRLSGLWGTFLFPAAWATTEFVMSKSPYGTWGSAAYSQYGNLPLLQIVSVTGLWGITFLIGWFAATGNWVWEEGLDSKRVRQGTWLCAGTIAGVMLLGGVRLVLFPPSSATVRVASLSKRDIQPELSDAVAERMFAGKATSEDMVIFRRWHAAQDEDLLARAEREMQAGAKIVFWAEANAPVMKADEAALLARGADLATQYHAYLGMAVGVWNPGKTRPFENKLILIQPNGQIAWEYNKVHPVPGPEAEQQVLGDRKLRVINTPYGRLSGIICFDGDFPQLLARAGALGADIVIDPSNDWRALDPWHTQMVSFRAIEQGVNLVRQTSRGLSAAYDYEGRRLAEMDHYYTTDYAMISEVPTRGVRTVYSRLGDWFAWLCVAALVGLAILSLRRKEV